MNSIYFHLIGGASGDMLISALVDLGVPLAHLKKEYKKLAVPFAVEEKKITGAHHAPRAIRFRDTAAHPVNLSYRQVTRLISRSRLSGYVKENACEKYKKLFEIERAIHRSRATDFRFHHLGELDAILEVCGFFIGLEYLGIDRTHVSAFPLDKPSPATRALLRNKLIQPVAFGYETVTPTAAVLLSDASQEAVSFVPRKSGVGFGDAGVQDYLIAYEIHDVYEHDTVMKIEATIDDMNPQLFEAVFDELYAQGAKEVYIEQVVAKKSRPAFVLNVLCAPGDLSRLRDAVFSQTTTFGIRYREYHRDKIPFVFVTKRTALGVVRFRQGSGDFSQATPEYRDCRAIAKKRQIPLLEVYRRLAQRR